MVGLVIVRHPSPVRSFQQFTVTPLGDTHTMVAHVSEFSGSFRRSPCSGRAWTMSSTATLRRPVASRPNVVKGHLRLVVDNDGPFADPPEAGFRHLDVQRAEETIRRSIHPSPDAVLARSGLPGGLTGTAAVVALAAVMLLVGVRLSQGVPPADYTFDNAPDSGAVSSSGVGSPGDLVVVAGPGDSLWSLAGEYAVGQDRRTAVATLVEANGGAAIVVGQAIVIPSQLLA